MCDANDGRFCNECADGVVTCSFDGVEATEMSSGGCQAQSALYDELCEAGSTATVEEVDEGRVCEEVEDTGV